jgi:AbrB family looped-hinge helix DNA binding protein
LKTVKVSKKYQVVIPVELRKAAKVKPGDKMIAISRHGIIEFLPVRPLAETKGMIVGLDTKDLRDEHGSTS